MEHFSSKPVIGTDETKTMSTRPGPATRTEEATAELSETEARTYSVYSADKDLAFDPMKDLNLPSSYEEVLARFEKLQGDRGSGALN